MAMLFQARTRDIVGMNEGSCESWSETRDALPDTLGHGMPLAFTLRNSAWSQQVGAWVAGAHCTGDSPRPVPCVKCLSPEGSFS